MDKIKVKYVFNDLTEPSKGGVAASFETTISGYESGTMATEELVIDFALEHAKQIVGHSEVHIVSVNHFKI